MNTQISDRTLPFGRAGGSILFSMARPAMDDPEACERLYDLARSETLSLIRGNRPSEEIETFNIALCSIAGLALSNRQYVMPHRENQETNDYRLQLFIRLKALTHLLQDQLIRERAYGFPQVLELPFVKSILELLLQKESVHMDIVLTELGIKHTSGFTFLADLRLITWSEKEKGDIVLTLTEEGKRVAENLSAN